MFREDIDILEYCNLVDTGGLVGPNKISFILITVAIT